MNDTTRTRVTRPDLSTTDDEVTSTETEQTTETSTPAEQEEAKQVADPVVNHTPEEVFTRPFVVNGASVYDAAGLLVCRAGAEHLTEDQRADVAGWLASKLA